MIVEDFLLFFKTIGLLIPSHVFIKMIFGTCDLIWNFYTLRIICVTSGKGGVGKTTIRSV